MFICVIMIRLFGISRRFCGFVNFLMSVFWGIVICLIIFWRWVIFNRCCVILIVFVCWCKKDKSWSSSIIVWLNLKFVSFICSKKIQCVFVKFYFSCCDLFLKMMIILQLIVFRLCFFWLMIRLDNSIMFWYNVLFFVFWLQFVIRSIQK